jgi:general secretion pathway protein G
MDEKGFTLIEMLLVVAIIGFLVAILLPSVGGFGANAKDKAVRADLRQLKSALEVYFISFSVYPDVGKWGTPDSALLTADGASGYDRIIDQFPEDPYENATNGCHFCYDYVLSGDTYVVASDKDATGVSTAGADTVTLNGATLYVTNARIIVTP